MKRVEWAVLTAVLGLTIPAAAQTAPPSQPNAGLPGTFNRFPSPGRAGVLETEDLELQILQDRWLTLEREQSELDKSLRDTLTRFPDNSPQVTEIRKRREEVAKEIQDVRVKIAAFNAAREERLTGRGRILLRPVAVQLQNATVRQAADALSQATKLSIRVAGDVPDATRLTVQARGVTLGAVLEAIGRQTNLKLAPADDGVVISPWPMVEVNGQQQVFRGRMAPWSGEWGLLPGYASRDGWVFPGEAEASDTPAAVPLPSLDPALALPGTEAFGLPGERRTPEAVNPGSDYGLGGSGLGGARSNRSLPSPALAISTSSLGDRMIVVTEPGRGGDNQAGAWITVYRLEGAQVKKVVSYFHALHAATSSGAGKPMGMPGMGGLPSAPPPSAAPSPAPETGQPGNVLIPGGPGGVPFAPTAPAAAPVTVRPAPAKKAPPAKK